MIADRGGRCSRAALGCLLVGVLFLSMACAPTASQRRDADIGKATYRDYIVNYGPPTLEIRDGSMKLVQWVEQRTVGVQGMVTTRTEIITIWFDENDVMRRWTKTTR
jgi:hypothetical protein